MAGRMVGRSVARPLLVSLVYLVLRRFLHVCFLPILTHRRFLRVRTADNPAFQRMRNVRDVRSTPPFIFGFSFLVEVGVIFTNPVDRVSLSWWTGRAEMWTSMALEGCSLWTDVLVRVMTIQAQLVQ